MDWRTIASTASSGSALVQGRIGPTIQLTIIPAQGATGVVTVKYKPPHVADHEADWEFLQAVDGSASFQYDLAGGQRTNTFEGYAEALLIESDSGAQFTVIVSG